ncbi:MAG: dephospho-CoA kinase [Congregibacter sp.]
MSAPLRVGITGGIGSGKSAVTDRLAAKGVVVVDADLIAREVVATGSPALAKIAERFGAELLQADGSLDRAALRAIVFADPAQRNWLESLTHPLIRDLIAERMNAAKGSYVVLSSPLLLEGTQSDFVDVVVVVDIPVALQLERTMRRDKNSEELVRAIMDAQLDRDARLQRADIVITNDCSLAQLDERVAILHEELLALAEQTRAASQAHAR